MRGNQLQKLPEELLHLKQHAPQLQTLDLRHNPFLKVRSTLFRSALVLYWALLCCTIHSPRLLNRLFVQLQLKLLLL